MLQSPNSPSASAGKIEYGHQAVLDDDNAVFVAQKTLLLWRAVFMIFPPCFALFCRCGDWMPLTVA